MKRTFKEILSELGERLDEAFTIKEVEITSSTTTTTSTTQSPTGVIDYAAFTSNAYVRNVRLVGLIKNQPLLHLIIVKFDDNKSRFYVFNTHTKVFKSVGINITGSQYVELIGEITSFDNLIGDATSNEGFNEDGRAAKL